MTKVISKDGTSIAFDEIGTGPAVIFVDGALVGDRSMDAPLAKLLSSSFTVFSYDRRGRGESGDTQPYNIAREVEDIEALIDKAGDSASLFGHSSGAVLALEAAAAFPSKVKKLALYEPPFIVDGSRPPAPADYLRHLKVLLSTNRRGEAIELFMQESMRVPEGMLQDMKQSPMWPGMEAIAHTLAYDGAILEGTQDGKSLPAERAEQWAKATMPTLIMDGGNSESFMHHAADALAKVLSHATRRTLEGQDHGAADEVLAPILQTFFK